MTLLNKQRQRQIRLKLHKTFPAEGSTEAELWEYNQQASPLLKLPPELRNRIYELVLHVGQVNVCYKRWEHKKRLRAKGLPCNNNKNDNDKKIDNNEGGFYCRLLPERQNPWETNGLKHRPQRGMTLLSGVCRQLYHETALLPYSLNAWSFESAHVMDRFVMKEKRLPIPHRRAIHLLYSQTVLTTALEKYFGGLKVVLVAGNIRMTKHIIDADPEHAGRRIITWEVSNPWWK
ncbi:hypothetical protein QBC35DRAFT_390883 [Podospora australis]|uniref:DUF7730 domain-containing protein n=1 Tax=Podospora australis TaxID=1536484 RepID=A0AAN6WR09_9PEZI|nr:hypothetical protein QBC35DRAFT_390883 [Podospora australis]